MQPTTSLFWFQVTKGRLVVSVLWQDAWPPIRRILLTSRRQEARVHLRESFPGAQPGIGKQLKDFQTNLQEYLSGYPVSFSSNLVALHLCSGFQRSVYLATASIPWGKVATYHQIASFIGQPGGSRAVGQALARNPFPIVIPCHRVIKADGSVGGFSAGGSLKKLLLQLEIWQAKTGRSILTELSQKGENGDLR
ncbi:MAG: methylated-DNA--[protein]-cysteine S-methyltransferase [Candidatus Omnitrophica bacterium]|nr:methylated-DNA--[protein]-cysteine S-methyltransferase [Candidatus Omnitrophota bacterium]